MWPHLAGPEWQWHLLATTGLLTVVFAMIWLADRAATMATAPEEPASRDPLLVLWHRYEVGDLTRREFEREKRALARRKQAPEIVWTRPPAMDPAARRALNGNARPSKQGTPAGGTVEAVIYVASSAERTSPGSA